MKTNSNIGLPYSIELLFENKYLDAMSVLCLLHAFNNVKKGIKVEEIIFYYSIVISETFNIDDVRFDELNVNYRYNLHNLYLSFQKNISEIILILNNLKYIEVIGDLSTKLKDLKIKLTLEGTSLLENTTNTYFTNLVQNFIKIRAQVKFTKGNEKTISGVGK